jgi:hypothetical protein
MRSDIEIAISALDKFQNRYPFRFRVEQADSACSTRIRLQPLRYKPVLQITSEAKARTYHGV